MKNIRANLKIVNSANVKQEWFSSLFSIFGKLLPNAKYLEKVGDSYRPVKRLFNLPQDRCSAGLPTCTALSPEIKENRSDVFSKSYASWKWVRDILATRVLTHEEIKRGLQQIEKSISVFSCEINGAIRHFEGNTKGTDRYAKKKAGQAMDFINNQIADGKECLFLTLTCDPSKFGSRAAAWENYDKEEIKPVLENLRKHYECSYIRVIESTANQYPHTHILLFFPMGTIAGYEKMKNKQVLRFGKIFKWVQKKHYSQVFRLECAKGDNLKYYLTKYIIKGTEQSILDLGHKEGELTKTELKTAVELVLLKAFRKHTIEKTKDKSTQGLKVLAEKKAARVFEERRTAERSQDVRTSLQSEKLSAREARRLLTSLCTNSPFSCACNIQFMSLARYRETFNRFPADKKSASNAEQKVFEKKCSSIGCAGCFYSEFVKFILDWNDGLINRKFYWNKKKGIFDKMCDGYDFDDDESFIECVKMVVDYYFTEMYIKGNSFDDIVECKQEITRKRMNIELSKPNRIYEKKWRIFETAVSLGYGVKQANEISPIFTRLDDRSVKSICNNSANGV